MNGIYRIIVINLKIKGEGSGIFTESIKHKSNLMILLLRTFF